MIIKLEQDRHGCQFGDFLVSKLQASRWNRCLEEDRAFNPGRIGQYRSQRKVGGLRVTHKHSTVQLNR
jgi:hypothetical protein